MRDCSSSASLFNQYAFHTMKTDNQGVIITHNFSGTNMENEILKRLIAIIARFDQGIIDAPGDVGIDKPAIREAKLIINSDHDTSFVYDLNHNDAAEIVGQFSLYKKGEDDVVSPIPISSYVQEGNIEGIEVKDILLN